MTSYPGPGPPGQGSQYHFFERTRDRHNSLYELAALTRCDARIPPCHACHAPRMLHMPRMPHMDAMHHSNSSHVKCQMSITSPRGDRISNSGRDHRVLVWGGMVESMRREERGSRRAYIREEYPSRGKGYGHQVSVGESGSSGMGSMRGQD